MDWRTGEMYKGSGVVDDVLGLGNAMLPFSLMYLV